MFSSITALVESYIDIVDRDIQLLHPVFNSICSFASGWMTDGSLSVVSTVIVFV